MEEMTLNKERVKKFFDVVIWLAIASNINYVFSGGWADVLAHAAVIFVIGFFVSIIFYIFYRFFSGKKAGMFVKKSVGSLLGVFPYLILIITALNYYYNYTNPLAFLVVVVFVIMLLIDILFWLMFFKIIIRKIDEGGGAKMMFLALFIMAIIVASTSGFLIWKNLNQRTVMCSQEAKLCPDGSYVGRTGPNCEFASCTDWGWKTTTGTPSFDYPEKLPYKYISAVDWPPQIQELNQFFSCTEGGSEIMTAGQTKKQTIGGTEYCVTKESEGAAGSVYTQYAYAFERNNKTEILTFSLRFVQCANYDDPEKIECEKERNSFSIDNTVNWMAKSIK